MLKIVDRAPAGYRPTPVLAWFLGRPKIDRVLVQMWNKPGSGKAPVWVKVPEYTLQEQE